MPKKTPEEEALDAADFLYEPEWKKTMVDANAVLLMSVAMFFWGFYAWFQLIDLIPLAIEV